MKDYRLTWGDAHLNLRIFQEALFEDAFQQALGRLDVLPIAYYPFEKEAASGTLGRAVPNDRGDDRPDAEAGVVEFESTGNRPLFLSQWDRIQELTASYYRPGEFVTFPGYEWHGNRLKWGDHNVFFTSEGRTLIDTPDLPALAQELLALGAIAIPHHTGYAVGNRGKDWSFHDPYVIPVAEIYSSHGCSEAIDSPIPMEHNRNMGPRTSGGTIVDGLLRGHKFGIIASSDAHYAYPGPWGRGLMALYVKELTREGVIEALRSRRCYGVTGDRIAVEFEVDGAFMGGEASEKKGPVEARWKVVGSDAIDRVEVVRAGRVVHTHSHRGRWRAKDEGRLKVRVEYGWGPDAADGFKTPIKRWAGSVGVADGKIVSVEPCFTVRENALKGTGDSAAAFQLASHQRDTRARNQGDIQSVVFEFKYRAGTAITIEMDGRKEKFTPAELFARDHLIADDAETRRLVEEQFGVRPEAVPNLDAFYHNAWKWRIERAVPEEGYTLEGAFVDNDPPDGETFYYLRVLQENGQAAWSSPVWVKR